jgi:hypothetical protein
MIGAGGQVTWVDPSRDLVMTSRWVTPERTHGLIERVVAALG